MCCGMPVLSGGKRGPPLHSYRPMDRSEIEKISKALFRSISQSHAEMLLPYLLSNFSFAAAMQL